MRHLARGLLVLIVFLSAEYLLWNPGLSLTDGRHDLGRNGIWLGHGWLGDDTWFNENARDTTKFRTRAAILELKQELDSHGFRDLFLHLSLTASNGNQFGLSGAYIRRECPA